MPEGVTVVKLGLVTGSCIQQSSVNRLRKRSCDFQLAHEMAAWIFYLETKDTPLVRAQSIG